MDDCKNSCGPMNHNRWSQKTQRKISHVKAHTDYLNSQYDVLKELGKGAFGLVSKAKRKSDSLLVAIKEISKSKAGTLNMKFIEREISILKQVDHPHVITLYEVIESDTSIHLIMELCDQELSKYLKEYGWLTEPTVKIIIERLADAITYLHKNDIVHRDLKLENILLRTNPSNPEDNLFLKVTDFGLSTVKSGMGFENMLQNSCGTLPYMALEILRQQPYNEKADAWAIGVIMFKLLCGEYPYQGDSVNQFIDNITQSDSPDFASVRRFENVSHEAQDLISGLMHHDTAHRLTPGNILHHPFVTGEETASTNVLDIMKSMSLETSRLNLPEPEKKTSESPTAKRTPSSQGDKSKHSQPLRRRRTPKPSLASEAEKSSLVIPQSSLQKNTANSKSTPAFTSPSSGTRINKVSAGPKGK